MKPEKKITVRYLYSKKKKGEKIVALSVYDATTAKFAEDAGIELLLVGDSLGMTVLGYKNTIPVTIEESLHHCKAVSRGAKFAFLVGDMPFMSYNISAEQAMLNASRYLQEAYLDAVKLEGGRNIAPTIERMARAGIPVMGHIGLLPQRLLMTGAYEISGKTEKAADALIEDARAIEDAGAFSIVLECVPSEVASRITKAVAIPTIGIGAGKNCDGQIQVVNDILGFFSEFTPRHSRKYADIGTLAMKAFAEYENDVRNLKFPSKENEF